jgi:hypothetical protein
MRDPYFLYSALDAALPRMVEDASLHVLVSISFKRHRDAIVHWISGFCPVGPGASNDTDLQRRIFDGDIAGLGDGTCRHKASWDVFLRRPRDAYTAVQLRRLRLDRFRTESERPLSGVHGRSRSIDELGFKADAQGTLDGSDHRRSR